MQNRKAFIRITCIVLVALMLLSLLSAVIGSRAYAASSSSIQAEIDDLNSQKSDIQDKMDSIQAEIDSLDYEKATVLEKKAILDQKNELAQEELDVIQEQIDIIDGLMTNMQMDLDDARAEEEYQRERWLTRVRAMEENSSLSYIDVLFNATSFSDLLTRLDLVNEVIEYDRDLEADYVAARENVEYLENEAEAMYAENEANKAELEAKKAQLEADIEAACQLVAQMEDDIDAYNAALEQEQETKAEIEALIVEKEADLAAAKAAEAAAAAAALASRTTTTTTATTETSTSTSETSSSSGTWMMWPSYAQKITSHYGYRLDPVTQAFYRGHAGTDIGASYGTAIYAAASGTVVLASYYGGYGNCVMINHGNGYTTLYGHMSSIAVSSGQTVSQGQTVGYVGSTGNSTGPHLHFEVRASSSGETIDPESFSYY
jgi:murein DD-endopeptidase MepM/ murein hydrolase activator NlpD